MTKPLPFTELAIRRAIAAAQKENLEPGWSVTVRPDGSITIQKDLAAPPDPKEDAPPSKWAS